MGREGGREGGVRGEGVGCGGEGWRVGSMWMERWRGGEVREGAGGERGERRGKDT